MPKRVVIDGNSRTGKLIAMGNKSFIGSRLVARGKYEEKKFYGCERAVRASWAEWRDEKREEAMIRVTVPRTAAKKQNTEKKVSVVSNNACPYDLDSFVEYGHRKGGRQRKADAYLRCSPRTKANPTGQMVLSCSKDVRELISIAIPGVERFIFKANENARLFAIVPNDSGQLLSEKSRGAKTSRHEMSIGSAIPVIKKMYGEDVSFVELAVEYYETAIIFKPTGRVEHHG